MFLRVTNDHNGARSDLIHDPATLQSELRRLEDSDIARDDMLIVEFCDTSDELGIYRKYDAFVVQGKVVPTDAYFSRQWMLKWYTSRDFGETPVSDDEFTIEELDHLQNTQGHDQLRQVARLANIDYGRVDYARRGDRIQVWEVNTNPDLSMDNICASDGKATPYGREVVPKILDAVFPMFRSLDNDHDLRVGIPLHLGNDFTRVD